MTANGNADHAARGLLAGSPEAMELRLALVCYGGVSLAIYMHGIAKELQSLLRASRAFDDGRAPDDGTERAYFDQLTQLRDAGLPVSVTIDLISGTSAGGINGVCLAKGVVAGSDQQGLTELWMGKGDITRLLRFGALGRRLGELATAVVLPFKMRKQWAPLKGDDMCRWLYSALADMDANAQGRSLLPDGGTLDLYVTATDLRGTDQIVPLGGGGSLHDRTYARVFAFNSNPASAAEVCGQQLRDAPGSFSIEDDHGALAFAARATSCFPGAFPPISLHDFAVAVNDQPGQPPFDPNGVAAQLMSDYRMLREDPTRVFFMDGGVLDNAPFDHLIDAIARQPAGRQVTRHIVYIEPDPGSTSPGAALPQAAGTEQPPTWVAGVWAGLSTIPHHQPLLGAIQQLAAMNEEAVTVGRIATDLQDDVNEYLRVTVADANTSVALSFDELVNHSSAIYNAVPDVIGTLNYRTYGRLKMQAVADRLARDLANDLAYPPTSAQASFLRTVFAAWLHDRKEWSGDDESRQQWLGPLDLPYRERRLEFIIGGINKLFDDATKSQLTHPGAAAPCGPTREQLATVKKQAWALLLAERGKPAKAIDAIRERATFLANDALTEAVLALNPRSWAGEHEKEIAGLVDAYQQEIGRLTADSAKDLWTAFTQSTADWDDAGARGWLASRYVGFPMWDALLFPVLSLSGLPLLNPVRATRFSPRDAVALSPPPKATGKLEGVATHHFGAFFALERRQNDYLWGRLDGVELILNLLRGLHENQGDDVPATLPAGDHIRRDAFASVLDAEQPALTKIGKLFSTLRGQL